MLIRPQIYIVLQNPLYFLLITPADKTLVFIIIIIIIIIIKRPLSAPVITPVH